MGWKAEIRVYRDSTFYQNGLTFATKEEADAYGADLFSRWTQAEEHRSVEVDGKPNYEFKDGKLTKLPEEGS